MARLSEGDRAAFDPLFRAFRPRALRLARVRLGEADAHDAAQTALEKVFARASEFTPGRPALPWFYAVVANEVHAITRRRIGSGDRGGAAEGVDVAADGQPEDDLLRAELRAALAEAIEALDPVSAAAIAALLGEGEEVHVTPATHRKRLSRAYARLRQLLGRFDEHES